MTFGWISGMSRKFREWQPDASWLFPPSPRDWLPDGHLVYFLLDVTSTIDISAMVDDYTGADDYTGWTVTPAVSLRFILG